MNGINDTDDIIDADTIQDTDDPDIESKEGEYLFQKDEEEETIATSYGKAVVPFDPLQAYLHEIKQYKLLTREEESELTIRVKEHQDEDAVYQLITANLRLVVKIAMNFHRHWSRNLLDLIQEGNVGLINAVHKFDPYRGVKFSYYASFWIKAYILKFIMDNWKMVKLGTTQSQRKLFFNLARERDKLISQGFYPEPKLLAEKLDVKEEEVVEMSQRLGGWDISINSPVGDDYRESFETVLPSNSLSVDEKISKFQRDIILKEALKEFRQTIKGKDADICDNRIMADYPLTLQELGDKYGISRERVRQIQDRLMKKITAFLKERIPDFESEYSDLIEND